MTHHSSSPQPIPLYPVVLTHAATRAWLAGHGLDYVRLPKGLGDPYIVSVPSGEHFTIEALITGGFRVERHQATTGQAVQAPSAAPADFTVENHGSVWLLTPETTDARNWVDENVALEPWQWLGRSFAVEPRLLDQLVEGIQAEGLSVEAAS
jgi:hypothetical protein